MELKIGQKVNLTIGIQATIVKELGRGGQGIVYLVDLNGEKMALKWYHVQPNDIFYKNLENNVSNGAPSNAFIWPEYLTVKENGSFGYIMKLRPQNYFEFGNYLLAKKTFKSFAAMLSAAMKICNGFKMLHRHGYSYQDLNDGNFFIAPDSGDVLICDNDNVMPQGEKSGIMGKARYMAPEVIAGSRPDKYSDRFSLSVILFMLFFANHPFEGAKVVACPCMTEEFEKKFYGSEALFVYDPGDKSNLPVRGVHKNVLRRWPVFPQILKDAFIQEFSNEKLSAPTSRMIEDGWERIISQVRDELISCPNCKEETFISSNADIHMCMNCGKEISVSNIMKIGNRQIHLTEKTSIFLDRDNEPDAIILTSPKNNGELVLKNLSGQTWTVETPSGKIKPVEPNGLMPVKSGLKIRFGALGNEVYCGEIINH